MTIRACFVSAAIGLTGLAHAGILVEDFTVGEYHSTINWPNTMILDLKQGLDVNHSLFGKRSTEVEVLFNGDHSPISLDIGGGAARVSYFSQADAVYTTLSVLCGNDATVQRDFSAEQEIWVDFATEDPPGLTADYYSCSLRDANGLNTSTNHWLPQANGFRFLRGEFNPNLDWSSIKSVLISTKCTQAMGDIPNAYAFGKIYTVPEPGTFVCVVLFGASALRSRRSKRAVRGAGVKEGQSH